MVMETVLEVPGRLIMVDWDLDFPLESDGVTHCLSMGTIWTRMKPWIDEIVVDGTVGLGSTPESFERQS